MHARLLYQIDWSDVGSAEYFATHCQPQTLAELPACDCLADNVMSAKDDMAQKKVIKLLPQYAPLPRRRLYGIFLPNRHLSSRVRLFLEAVERGGAYGLSSSIVAKTPTSCK